MTDGEGAAVGATATSTAPKQPEAGESLVLQVGADGNGEAAPELANGSRGLTYNPALDGIRALAVVAVMLFHQEFDWAKGGYLGVSTFFTLSGFLITSLLLIEHGRTGRIGLTAFWARRLRRLLPAAAVTLAVVMLAALFTDEVWERSLGGDVIAAALNVANWRFLFADVAYGAEGLQDSSPVLHFWSLAIEEQFYWVFPLLTAGVLAITRGSLRVFALVLGGLFALAGILTILYSSERVAVYYLTPIRMGEIVVGALLAVAVTKGRLTGERDRTWHPLMWVVGGVALLVSVVTWATVDEESKLVSHGGLLVYALISGALLLGASVEGPLKRALSFEPLRLLGLISYGVYLIHWPVYQLLDEGRADRLFEPLSIQPRGWELFAVRFAVTLALAIASYVVLEQPIRRGRWPKPTIAPQLAAGGVASVVVVGLVVPQFNDPPLTELEQAQRTQDYLEVLEGLPPEELAPDAKIGINFGDSTGLMTFMGVDAWGRANRRLVEPGGAGGIGCGLVLQGEIKYQGAPPAPSADEPLCHEWEAAIATQAQKAKNRYGRLDFALVQFGPRDVADHKLEGSDEWVHIGDPDYDAVLRAQMERVADVLTAQGATVVWLTSPYTHTDFPESEPERTDRFNDMVKELAEEREGVVVVDLHKWVDDLSAEEDKRMRDDGIHWTQDGSPDMIGVNIEVAERWLGDEVLKAATRERPPGS